MLIGKIEYWAQSRKRGYGFIVVRHDDGQLDKFFVLGNRLLFERTPELGDVVSFDVTDEKPRHEKGYPLVTNVRLVKPTLDPIIAPLGFVSTDNIQGLISKDGEGK